MVAERDAHVRRHVATRRSILIVDDQEEIRELLSDVLLLDGHSTRTAANGEDALRSIRRERPDLVTLDLAMPGLDGHGVLRELAGNPSTSDIPVIVVSAYTSELTPTPQVVRVVTKPFEVSELVELIRWVFSQAC